MTEKMTTLGRVISTIASAYLAYSVVDLAPVMWAYDPFKCAYVIVACIVVVSEWGVEAIKGERKW